MKKVQENQKNQKKKNKGFTLVELIIVIAIIAILAIVLAPQYIKYVEKSRWSNDVNQMSELVSMVKTAIVETEDAGGSVVAQQIKVTKNADITGAQGSLSNQLKSDDPKYNTYRLKNNGNHKDESNAKKLDGTTQATTTSQYTISVYQDNGAWVAVGGWE